jgi:hypothetical protein
MPQVLEPWVTGTIHRKQAPIDISRSEPSVTLRPTELYEPYSIAMAVPSS